MSFRARACFAGGLLAAAISLLAMPASAGKPRPGGEAVAVTVTLQLGNPVTAPPGGSGAPGVTIVYNFLVQNTSGVTQDFTLSLNTSARWKAFLPQNPTGRTGPLAPAQTVTVPVAVVIPAKAAIGSTGNTTLKATSTGKPRVSGQGTVVTTVVAPSGLALTLEAGAAARPGGTVTYRATITNESKQAQRVTVTGRSGHGWRVTPVGPAAGEVIVLPGGSVDLTFEVAVPKDASAIDDALIVSVGFPDSASGRMEGVGVTHVE